MLGFGLRIGGLGGLRTGAAAAVSAAPAPAVGVAPEFVAVAAGVLTSFDVGGGASVVILNSLQPVL